MDNNQISQIYDSFKPHLDKISSPLFITAKDIQGKIVARSNLLQDLEDHMGNETLPKTITPMRQPQVPKGIEEAFTIRFKEITMKANKEILQALINLRKEELDKLKEELSMIGNKIEQKTNEVMSFIQNKTSEVSSIQKQIVQDQYSKEITERLKNQKSKIETSCAFNAYHAEEKSKAIEAAKVIKAAAAEEDTDISKLRKELETMKRLIVQKKQDEPPKKPRKTPNKTGKKDVKKQPLKRNPNTRNPPKKGSKNNNGNQGKVQSAGEGRAARRN